jgi:hypothetical protein
MIERERAICTCKQLNIKICDANIYHHHTLLTRNVWNNHYVAKIGYTYSFIYNLDIKYQLSV